MHIADNILTTPILAAGAAAAGAGVAAGLWKMDPQRVPRVAVLSAAFFVSSLVHVPIPGTSAHLTLVGLVGVILGWEAFPAFLIALLLQALLGHGGLTALGVNTMIFAAPAVMCHYLFRAAVRRPGSGAASGFAAGCLAGMAGVAAAAVLASAVLMLSGEAFYATAAMLLAAHVPIGIVEGLVTGSVVASLKRISPELLAPRPLAPATNLEPPDA